MKYAVIGSRDFNDYDLLEKILLKEEKLETVISGKAPGADRLAAEFAEKHSKELIEYKAKWDDLTHPDALIKVNKYGKKYDARAGFRRNQLIIDDADVVLAFWDGNSTGTLDALKKAKKAGKITKIIKYLLL